MVHMAIYRTTIYGPVAIYGTTVYGHVAIYGTTVYAPRNHWDDCIWATGLYMGHVNIYGTTIYGNVAHMALSHPGKSQN